MYLKNTIKSLKQANIWGSGKNFKKVYGFHVSLTNEHILVWKSIKMFMHWWNLILFVLIKLTKEFEGRNQWPQVQILPLVWLLHYYLTFTKPLLWNLMETFVGLVILHTCLYNIMFLHSIYKTSCEHNITNKSCVILICVSLYLHQTSNKHNPPHFPTKSNN